MNKTIKILLPFPFKFKEVTAWDILSIIKSLRSPTASGYDDIPTSLIKDGAQELSASLVTLINLCLRQSVFLDAEKIGRGYSTLKYHERNI